MPKIQFSNGQIIEFKDMPSMEDIDSAAKSLNLQPLSPETQNQPEKRSLGEKILGFTGGEKIAQGLGQAFTNPEIAKQQEETQKQQFEIQGNLIKAIKAKRATGEDATKLEKALADLSMQISDTGNQTGELLNQKGLTTKQVVGDALQLGTTVASVGSFGKGFVAGGKEATSKVELLKNVLTNTGRQKALPSAVEGIAKATSFGQGLVQGAKTGAISGGVFGTATGVSQGLQKDKDLGGIIGEGLLTGVGGAVTGGILGGVIGGVSGGIRGRQLRNEVLNKQIEVGQKTAVDMTKLTPQQNKAIEIAKQQGYDASDVDFMMSMKPTDKAIAGRQIEMANKALNNKRFIERPIDLVGEGFVKKAKSFEALNTKAGKAVETTAKALRGQKVDALPVREKALSLLEDAGVFANKDGTPNWSKSIFNKTPDLKNKLMKTLSDLPAGEIDAYDLHNFKKSIDEVVNYGVKGEGLKGKSASILKAIRNSADEILDTTFDSYNTANTDYKITREVLDQAKDLFGKKNGFSKEKGGQIMRAVFSNRDSRGRVLKLLGDFDEIGAKYGLKSKDNLVDQALFTEILEDIYGTQATTSLQGQVARAVKGTQRVIEGVRDPLKGAGDLLATGAEKFLGVSDENKKKILSALIR